jgi:hypothetical protein
MPALRMAKAMSMCGCIEFMTLFQDMPTFLALLDNPQTTDSFDQQISQPRKDAPHGPNPEAREQSSWSFDMKLRDKTWLNLIDVKDSWNIRQRDGT